MTEKKNYGNNSKNANINIKWIHFPNLYAYNNPRHVHKPLKSIYQ